MPQIDLGRVVGEKGERGVSVTGVELAGGTHAPGTTDTYKVTLDSGADGGSFTVYNGKDGPAGPEGPRGEKGEPGLDATVNGHRAVTLAAEGNVELEQRDGALTLKTSAALDAAAAWRCNRNLLDNWYFANPVNQRGKTAYTGAGYTIDRIYAESGSVRVTENGVAFSGGVFVQRVAESLAEAFRGQTATISCLTTDGALYSGSGALGVESFGPAVPGGFLGVQYFSGETQFFRLNATETVSLAAVKLELGPTQTLAHKEGETWVLNEIPDYGQELAKCQRYFAPILIGGPDVDLFAYIYTPAKSVFMTFRQYPAMRATPVCVSTLSGGVRIVNTRGILGSIDGAFTVGAFDGVNVVVYGTYTSEIVASDGEIVYLDAVNATGGLFLDAEL